ncbi:MAG: hypothetical protein H8D70_02775 [Rhodospirillaceae bacterium]|nr:hypothetical protein [Rhodospirillaceae bacterium]
MVYWAFTLKALHRLRRLRISYEDLFAGLNLFVFFFANLTESYAFKATSIYQMLFTLSLVILSKRRDFETTESRRNTDASLFTPDAAEQTATATLRSRSSSPTPEEPIVTEPQDSTRTFLRPRERA